MSIREMILYKYVSFEAGKKIILGNSIGFSQTKFFNDPFDLPLYPEEDFDHAIAGMFAGLHTMAKNYIWAENTGISSLTRTPTNPLMWAHYANKHEGMVIGIDTVIAGLTREESNLIPAQYGSVIYVSRRSNEPFISKPQTGLAVGATHHFPADHYEKLQRLFLHKPMCWAYEEEVRVVKCLKGVSSESSETPSGQFKIVKVDNRDLYLLNLPPNSLKEVYLGIRADDTASDDLFHESKKLHPLLSVYECSLDRSNLAMGFHEYMPVAGRAVP